jgi:hypothetical protein
MKKALFIALLLFPSVAFAQFNGGFDNGGSGSGGGGSGTVTSIATACGVSGGPITTTGTIQGAAVIRAATGTTDTILSSDCGKVVTESNAAAVAVTLPQATGAFGAPFFFTIVNLGAGTVTITPTTSTINSNTTLTLLSNQSSDIASDGTNYVAILGKGGNQTTDASQLTSGTLAAARLPAFTGDCTTSAGSSATKCDAPHPGYLASNWYAPGGLTTYSTGNVVTANRIQCKFGYVPERVTIGALGARVTTVGSTNFQLAIYTNVSGRPGALLSSTGNILNTGLGVVTGALAANKQVGPAGSDGGRDVWWCFNNNDSTAVFVGDNTNTSASNFFSGSATAGDLITAASGGGLQGIYCTGAGCNGGSSTFNTWPASLAGSTWLIINSAVTGNQIPAVIFQAASVP